MIAEVTVVPLYVVAGWCVSLLKDVDDFASDLPGFMFNDAAFGKFQHGRYIILPGNKSPVIMVLIVVYPPER